MSTHETENVRLHSEIGRLRSALTKAEKLISSQVSDYSNLREQVDQAEALNRANVRTQSMAIGTSDSKKGELLGLQSEVDAWKGRCTQLETELVMQSKASEARLAELSDNYSAKVKEMRRLHEEQMISTNSRANKEVQELQAQLESSKHQVASQDQELSTLRKEIAEVRKVLQQAENGKQQLVTQEQELAALRVEVLEVKQKLQQAEATVEHQRKLAADMSASLDNVQREKQVLKQQAAAVESKTSQAAAPPMAMIDMMEKQLVNLSAIIKAREVEIANLRATVQAGCDERRELAAQLQRLQVASVAEVPSVTPTTPPKSSSASDGSSLHSPSSYMVSRKPHRSGLTSQPKFR